VSKTIIRSILNGFENVGLLLVLLATLVAIGQEVWGVIEARTVTLTDILLLFIYLEVIALIGIYYESHRLPVRYPIYIAIIALARYIILDSKQLVPWGLVAIGITILLLTAAVLMLRMGHVRFPYKQNE
jgi:protein PsiE